MTVVTIPDRRQTGRTDMRCDASVDGVRCPLTEGLRDIGGDTFVGSGVRFVVKYRLCQPHRDQWVNAGHGPLVERT